ncbi:MAG: hypothetical protein E7083_05625 [Bacteroidales bacterium]|nr:hypothetical protein [Bacteroidales bacterium]
MENINQVPNGADIPLVMEIPTINGEPYDAKSGVWEVELWVFSNKRVKVRHSADGYESLGEVPTTADVNDSGEIELYVKSSKVPMGKGYIKGQMTIYAPNTDFIDSVQVIKTLECDLGIQIV